MGGIKRMFGVFWTAFATSFRKGQKTKFKRENMGRVELSQKGFRDWEVIDCEGRPLPHELFSIMNPARVPRDRNIDSNLNLVVKGRVTERPLSGREKAAGFDRGRENLRETRTKQNEGMKIPFLRQTRLALCIPCSETVRLLQKKKGEDTRNGESKKSSFRGKKFRGSIHLRENGGGGRVCS